MSRPPLSRRRRSGRRHRGAPVRPADLRRRLAADRERLGRGRRQVRHGRRRPARRCAPSWRATTRRRWPWTRRGPRAWTRWRPRSRSRAGTSSAGGPGDPRALRSGHLRGVYEVPALSLPFIGGFGRAPFRVRSTHSELVDPFRSGVAGRGVRVTVGPGRISGQRPHADAGRACWSCSCSAPSPSTCRWCSSASARRARWPSTWRTTWRRPRSTRRCSGATASSGSIRSGPHELGRRPVRGAATSA